MGISESQIPEPAPTDELKHTSVKRRARHGEGLAWLRNVAKNPPEGCAIWPFGVMGMGYGVVSQNGLTKRAHRVALVFATGVDPQNMDCAHGPCHNILCCNPNHLSWKTHKENIADRKRDGTHVLGQACAISKITENQAKEIISLRGKVRQQSIADRFGVTKALVSSIQTGRCWKHLDRPEIVPYHRVRASA